MYSRLLLAIVLVATAVGCQVTPWPMRMFQHRDKTTYRTAHMRMDAIRDIGQKATGVDSPEQQELVNELARQIQVEPDPLVREVIIDSVAEFQTPLAAQVLEAGLQDEDAGVRRHCCQAFGRRGDPASIPVLARVINVDNDVDTRLAAVKALGEINSPDAYAALAVAMEARDPAMQLAGANSMKAISGKDLGGDISSWIQLAKGENPTPREEEEISVARRLRGLTPF